MTKKPSISVVVPAFNEQDYIEQTLKSLKKQTLPYSELLVVDNNSTDDTAKIAKKYGATVIKEMKQGYVHALNTGLKSAKGDIIAVTDADSEPSPDWLATIAEVFSDPKIVGTSGEMVFKTKNKMTDALIRAVFASFVQANFNIGKPHISGCNFAVRKSVIAKVGGADSRYKLSADVDLGLRIKKYGKVVYCNKQLVTTSVRRWNKGALKAFSLYSKAYIYAVWLRKSPNTELNVIR